MLARLNQASQVVCALRDGRMVTAETVGGKSRLLLIETGKARFLYWTAPRSPLGRSPRPVPTRWLFF